MGRKTVLGTDVQGHYRRHLGWKLSGGKRVQHLFRLGKSEAAAHAANLRLEATWGGVEARGAGSMPRAGPGRTNRSGMTSRWPLPAPSPRGSRAAWSTTPRDRRPQPARAGRRVVGPFQARYPVIPIRLDQPDLYLEGVGGILAIIEVNREMLRQLGEPASTRTLHQALDTYRDYLGEKYRDKPSRRPLQRTVVILRAASRTLPSIASTPTASDIWPAYWCRRPAGKRGRMAGTTTCRNALIGLRQFLRWLSRSPQWDWQIPAGFSFPKCKIAPDDRPKPRKTFNVEELGRIWACALPWDRR